MDFVCCIVNLSQPQHVFILCHLCVEQNSQIIWCKFYKRGSRLTLSEYTGEGQKILHFENLVLKERRMFLYHKVAQVVTSAMCYNIIYPVCHICNANLQYSSHLWRLPNVENNDLRQPKLVHSTLGYERATHRDRWIQAPAAWSGEEQAKFDVTVFLNARKITSCAFFKSRWFSAVATVSKGYNS